MKPAPKARRGGWSGGPVPDGRQNTNLAILALLAGVLLVGAAAWLILGL